MIRSKEKWQAHMNRVGGSMLRNETAELSQRFAQFGAKRRLDTVSIRYDLSTNMDMWVKDYRPTKRSIDDGHVRSYARRAAKYHWDYIVRSLAKAYGVGRTTIERIGSGMLSDFQQQASDQAASEYGDAFGAMASPNWTPGAHLEEALTEANPNVYNFTYGTQNTARFGARRGDAAW